MSSFEEIFNFTLSYDNVKATQFDKYEKNFRFIVNDQIFSTNHIIADILSTKIANSHFSDPTINEITIKADIGTYENDSYYEISVYANNKEEAKEKMKDIFKSLNISYSFSTLSKLSRID